MTTDDVLAALGAAGVRLFVAGGRLRFAAPPGAYDRRLRALVDARRADLAAALAPAGCRADAELAAVGDALARLGRSAAGRAGRAALLGVWDALARRWHAAGDGRLFEIRPALADLRARWADG